MGFGMRGRTIKECKKEHIKASVPTMKSFQVKGKETEELKQLYKILQQDWDALKQSNSTTASRKYSATSNATIKAIQLGYNSPRDLMSKLQQESSSPAEAWKKVTMMRTIDVAAQEILQDRREAIESGKLKGRRLFVPMEGEGDKGFRGWTTDTGPHCEVRSLSFCYSEDEHEDESSGSKGQPHCTRGCSYSSSSSSSSRASVDKDQEVKMVEDIVATVAETRVVIGRPGNGGRYAVFLGGLAIALLIIAICMSSVRSSGGWDYEVILVPT